jgi:hypothetical protein
MISTLLLYMFLAAAPSSVPLPCTAANAKPVTFRFIERNAASVPGMCVKVTGYQLGTSLFASKAAAKRQGEPDWQMIGLDGGITPSQAPTRVTVFGRMEDCGSAMQPSYCHYVGGSVIRDAQIAT